MCRYKYGYKWIQIYRNKYRNKYRKSRGDNMINSKKSDNKNNVQTKK